MSSSTSSTSSSDSDDIDEYLAIAAFCIIQRRRRRRNRPKRLWIRPWLTRRDDLGSYNTLMQELANEDIPSYISFQRLHPQIFDELLHKVTPLIQKQDTNMRMAIPPAVRLALTLRYLATGNTYMSHQFEFRVAANTIGKIVPETCAAIFSVLRHEFFTTPKTAAEWKSVADGFQEKWQFPNCLGALDGKHVLLRPPAKSGSYFFNYKHTFSIVLMALVDSDYKFLYAHIGTNGRVSDGGVFAATDLHRKIKDGNFEFPPASAFPGDDAEMNYMFVADEAFPLRSYLMKPYPFRKLQASQRVFNYRLSRARRVVENAFGILANRFRVFQTAMLITPERAEKIVLAACALHNMLRVRKPQSGNALADQENPETHELIMGAWRQEEAMQDLQAMRGNNATKAAKAQRDYISAYFNSPAGSVSWQDAMI